MTPSPLVSVVMSVFNGERYLRAAAESVLAQDGVELELLIVDDGSTDGSPRILAELAARDPRVTVLRQENAGLTRALMRGCAEARGDLIARQDADDVSEPGRLRRQVERLTAEPSVALSACGVKYVGPEDEPLYESRFPDDRVVARVNLLAGRGNPAHGSAMFRRRDYEKAGGYRWQLYFAQDSDLWMRLLEIGEVAFEPEALYRLRVSETSLTSRYRAVQARLQQLILECRDVRLAGGDEAPLLDAASRLRPGSVAPVKGSGADGAYFLGRCLLRRRDPRARRYLRRYLEQRPFGVKGWASLAQAMLVSRGL